MSRLGTLLLCSTLVLAGCAGNPCLPGGDLSGPTPAAAAAGGLEDRPVRWGGVVASIRNLPDRTELEVVGYPLDGCGRPLTQSSPVGRFMLVSRGYLEPGEFQPGRLVTASGRIAEVRTGRVGSAPYRFPVLEGPAPHLWTVAQGGGTFWRPWLSIGIGTSGSGVGGGVGISF